MNVYELVDALGGEIVRNRARYRTPDGYVVLGKINGDTMEFTEAGRALAAQQEEPTESQVTKPARKSQRAKLEPVPMDEFET